MAKYKIIPSSRTIVQSPISIGHKAEKGVEAIEFDLTAWVKTYGSGTLTVIIWRWGDAIPYPIALEIDENNKATWTLSDTDTAKAGMAYAQLSYIVGDEVVKKSDIYTFRVMDSLTGEGDPPEAYESWLEHLTHFAAEAMAEVLDIEGIVTDKTLTVDGGIADGKATGDALALKADKSTTYTKVEVDQMIGDVEVETDTTLSVSGAPADAKKTGDELSALKADLGALKPLQSDVKVLSAGVDSAEIYVSHAQATKEGLNVVWTDDDTFTCAGTPASRFINLNGATTRVDVAKGETYTFSIETESPKLSVNIWVKHNDGTTDSIFADRVVSYKVRSDDKGVIFRIVAETTYIEATCKVSIVKNITPLLVDTVAAGTGIAIRLSTFGRCILGKGVFAISNTITMPSNSLIIGYGKDSVISHTGSGTCIVMGDRSSIKEVTIQGSDSDIELPIYDNITSKHAIEWTGETVQYGTIESCVIERFSGSGIYAHDTMTPTDHNLMISNCAIRNCCVGVYIRKDSEFIKTVNCTITRNTIGMLNRGGNNITANCGIDSNVTNIIVDDEEGSNGGHGAITNCSLNHADSNNGYGLIISGTGRMLVTNCNFYYSKVKLVNTKGNIINSCGFGNNAIIEADEQGANRCDIVTNCMFLNYTNVVKRFSGNLKLSNCWTRDGVEIAIADVS